MGVHRQPREPECDAPDHICRLATDSGERHQLLQLRRDLAAEPTDDTLCHPDQAACLGPKEACRADQYLDVGQICGRQCRGVRKAGEERRGRQVDPFVRALGGKNGGSDQLKRTGVVERTQLLRRTGEDRAQSPVHLSCSPSGSARSGHGPETTGSFFWMEGLDLAVVTIPDRSVTAEIHQLIDRVTASTGHAALSEHKRAELARAADGTAEPTGARPLFVGVVGRVGTPNGQQGRGGLVAYAELLASSDSGEFAIELAVDPKMGGRGVGGRGVRDALLQAVVDEVLHLGGGVVRLWSAHASPSDDALASAHGFRVERNLIQMRCPLPASRGTGRSASDPPVPIRPFRPGLDEPAWLATNNRAFARHPEQGHWDMRRLLEREQEPWFDPNGFLLLEESGRIAGSCWTKIHPDADPPMGEIYVIGVDPAFHGRGWGRALTLAGLDWLAAAGMAVGMLYVDAENVPAVSMYHSIGFADDHVDRAYVGRFDPS